MHLKFLKLIYKPKEMEVLTKPPCMNWCQQKRLLLSVEELLSTSQSPIAEKAASLIFKFDTLTESRKYRGVCQRKVPSNDVLIACLAT